MTIQNLPANLSPRNFDSAPGDDLVMSPRQNIHGENSLDSFELVRVDSMRVHPEIINPLDIPNEFILPATIFHPGAVSTLQSIADINNQPPTVGSTYYLFEKQEPCSLNDVLELLHRGESVDVKTAISNLNFDDLELGMILETILETIPDRSRTINSADELVSWFRDETLRDL